MRVRRTKTAMQHSDGYTLVAAVVLVAVVSVLIAVALPSWTQVIQRDKEEELIFRGMQYAEAIRIFQQRFGRYPMRLEELVSVNPRCIRQLWKDPMTKNGEWGLIYAQGAGGGPGARGRRGGVAPNRPQQGAPVAGGSGPSRLGGRQGGAGRRSGRAVAPILGVHSISSEKAIKLFAGGQSYSDWLFTADTLPIAQVVPGTLNLVRANATWFGRPFPPDLGPQSGGTPTTLQQGTAPSQEIQRSRRKRNGN